MSINTALASSSSIPLPIPGTNVDSNHVQPTCDRSKSENDESPYDQTSNNTTKNNNKSNNEQAGEQHNTHANVPQHIPNDCSTDLPSGWEGPCGLSRRYLRAIRTWNGHLMFDQKLEKQKRCLRCRYKICEHEMHEIVEEEVGCTYG